MGLASQFVGKRRFSTEIFVSRLSFYTTEEELKNVFSPFGAVEEARLVRDNQTGRPKGFGFVKYSSQEEAQKAVKAMDGRVHALLTSLQMLFVYTLTLREFHKLWMFNCHLSKRKLPKFYGREQIVAVIYYH